MSAALPKQQARTKHRDALPWKDAPRFLHNLRGSEQWAGETLALEWALLTACRSGEACGATWAEIDGDEWTWTIPAERTKARQTHRVPLSAAARAVVAKAEAIADGTGLLFPSPAGKPIHLNNLTLLARATDSRTTVHGLRSTFRDWARDTGVSREIAEAALAHIVGGVEGAYARSDMLEARRPVMEAWAAYLNG